MHQLGSKQWEKAKRKAAEKIRDVAAELLDIYARRAAKTGFRFLAPGHDYQALLQLFLLKKHLINTSDRRCY